MRSLLSLLHCYIRKQENLPFSCLLRISLFEPAQPKVTCNSANANVIQLYRIIIRCVLAENYCINVCHPRKAEKRLYMTLAVRQLWYRNKRLHITHCFDILLKHGMDTRVQFRLLFLQPGICSSHESRRIKIPTSQTSG